MALGGDKSPDGEDSQASKNDSMTVHSTHSSGMPVHMYSLPPGVTPPQPSLRSKRRQVKNACTNCQKACKKCDNARPCLRCVKYSIAEECVDSQRKERRKGIKRGPYKKHDGKGNSVEQIDAPKEQDVPTTNWIPIPSGPPMPFMTPVSYPPFYSQYASGAKPGEGPYYQPIYMISPHPPQLHPVQDGEHQPAAPCYPSPAFTYPQHYQFSIPGPHYAAAYALMFHSGPSSNDMGGMRDTGGVD